MPPDHVHFNGSVNLADAESVMREIAARLPSGLRRIPDGETGDRGNWTSFQLQKFRRLSWLVPAQPPDTAEVGYNRRLLRLADGVDPAEVSWPDIGYAQAYVGSYAIFAALRDQGVIPAGVRFQVEYPTPLASISLYIVPEQRQALLASYTRAVFADLARLLSEIPHGEVAVQWDVAVEFGLLEEVLAPGGAQDFDPIVAALACCIDQVPADSPAGLHLCYGDSGHQHFKQPTSLALQVQVLNSVSAAAGRQVNFVSFTVPQYQREQSYFAPLAQLTADRGTELNFALVPYHPAGQAPGTTDAQVLLIDAALKASSGDHRTWGVCTECGMGRVDRNDIPALLDLHRQIVEPIPSLPRKSSDAQSDLFDGRLA
jgi:hypothetical protein